MNNFEVTIGEAERWSPGNAQQLGGRAQRWDATGGPPVELGNLGTSPSGVTNTSVGAINGAGVIVGQAELYDANGTNLGFRAVHWDPGSNAAVMFPGLGTSPTGVSLGRANSINASGVAVGLVSKFTDTGAPQGQRAVRWDVGAAAAIELPSPGSAVTQQGFAYDISDSGWIVGQVQDRAVRWTSAGTPTLLGNLSPNGAPLSAAYEVNALGTAIGVCKRYSAGGEDLGIRSVRWWSQSLAGEELKGIGSDPQGNPRPATAVDINDSNKIVGYAQQFTQAGLVLGVRALYWDDTFANAFTLPNLSTAPDGSFHSRALAVNNLGAIAGYSTLFAPDGSGVDHATYWSADGAIHDLNSLIDPPSGWILRQAYAINDNYWVSGLGTFDPDGPGGQQAYTRLFLLAIPEPATFCATTAAVMTVLAARPGGIRGRRRQAR